MSFINIFNFPLLTPAAAKTTPAVTVKPTAASVVLANTTANALGSIANLGQQFQVQTYNADGNVVTKTIGAAQIAQKNFTPETQASLQANLQTSEATLIASLKLSSTGVAKVWQDSVKIDYLLCIKSQQSLPVDFNTMQTPTLQSSFTYNFYAPDEENLTVQEDQTLDPLLTNAPVPRFVQLNWDVTSNAASSPDFASRTQSERQMASTYFSSVRGNATLANQPTANSFQKNLAQVTPIYRNGQALTLVDTHDLERGFNSTSNSRLFKCTATTTVNTRAIDTDSVNFNEILWDELV